MKINAVNFYFHRFFVANSINPSESRGPVRSNYLQIIKSSSSEVIQSALLAIESAELNHQRALTPLRVTLTDDQSNEISILVSSVFQENNPLLSQANAAGYESTKDYVVAELTQALWDCVQVIPDRDNSGIVFLLPPPEPDPPPLNIVSIFDVMKDRLENIMDVEKARSYNWVISERDAIEWPNKVARCNENYEILKSQVLNNVPRELFSGDPVIRRCQYSTFLNKIHRALEILSSQNEDYDFYDVDIPYLLNNCLTAWETSIDMLSLRADPALKGNIFSKAHRIARGLRESVLITYILPSALRHLNPQVSQEEIDNVHNKKAAKQWGNKRLRLGFSSEQLGEKEFMLDVLAPHLDFVIREIMEKQYTSSVVLDALKQHYDKQSELDKNLVWDLILDGYKKSLTERTDLYIDPMTVMRTLYQSLEATQRIESFEEYSKALKVIYKRFLEKDLVPPFEAKTPYESIYIALTRTVLQRALSQKKDLHLELDQIFQADKITLAQKKELENLIKDFENSESEDSKRCYLREQKSQIAEVISHLDQEIISKNALLLKKMSETPSSKLTPFGAALIGVFTKIVNLPSEINTDLPNRILYWASRLPIPTELTIGLVEKLSREPHLYLTLPEEVKRLPEIETLAQITPGLVHGVTDGKYFDCMQDPISAFIRGDLVEFFEDNMHIVWNAIHIYSPALRFVTNKEIVLEVLSMHSDFFPFVNEILKNDIDVVRIAVHQNSSILRSVMDKDIILSLLQENGILLSCVNDHFINDRDVIWTAFVENNISLQFAINKDVIHEIINENNYALEYIFNKDIVLDLVNRNGNLLRFSSEVLRNDIDVVWAAVQNHPQVLQSVKDVRILTEVVNKNAYLFEFANDFFKKNPAIVWNFVQNYPIIMRYITSKQVILEIVKRKGNLLCFANEFFRNDIDAIWVAVNQDRAVLKSVTKKRAVLNLVARNGMLLKDVNLAFQDNKDIVLAAVTQNKTALQFASRRLQQDLDLIRITQGA